MLIDTAILTPVIALVVWSLIMLLWLYVTRIPAVKALNIELDPTAQRGEQMAKLPPSVRWKSDNYANLMEQPTIFYALVLSLALLGEGSGINVTLAWTYVLIRIVHSLVQALVNKIEVRFALFILSNIPLLALAFNAISAVC